MKRSFCLNWKKSCTLPFRFNTNVCFQRACFILVVSDTKFHSLCVSVDHSETNEQMCAAIFEVRRCKAV